VLARLKTTWKKLREFAPGERFEKLHREHRNRSPAVKAVLFGIAFVSFAAGLVLALIPGPAFLFFALSGALLATQSLWIARRLDELEVLGRNVVASVRRWRRRN
jgi:hypothetical protein